MLASRRGRFFLKWLRNLLLTGGILCLYLGVATAIDLRRQAEQELPAPLALSDDPAAAPAFNEEAASAMPYSNCLACHWDKLATGAALAAAPNDRSLQAQVARILQGNASGRAERQDESTVVPIPTLPSIERTQRPGAASTPESSPIPSTTPTPGPVPGVPVRMLIPSLEIDSPVIAVGATVQNGRTVWEVPRDVVGWYQATALAGAEGNIVMSGHVAQREGPAVFRDLYQIRVGDPIFVDTAGDRLAYFVRDLRIVLPAETKYLQPSAEATLTLITCAGRYDAATRTFSHRLIVIAKPAANLRTFER